MRICYFGDALAEHTRRWAKFFAERGHSVELITWNQQHLPDYEPVRLHVIDKPLRGNGIVARVANLPILLSRIKRLLREINPDIVHVHSVTSYAWLIMLSGFRPYVLTPWGTDINIDIDNSLVTRTFSGLSLKRASLVICDAQFVKAKLIQWGLNADNVEVVMFGVDLRRIPNEKRRSLTLIRDYDLDDSPIVISTRLLTKIRDVETFVRAIQLVKKVVSRVIFVIVGSGPEREYLEDLVRSNGIHDSVRFVGHVTEKEMIEWLCTSDIYVSTSLTDAGLAASTAEAMACGLPVITTDNSENGAWIHEGQGGFLYPNMDAEGLAKYIIRLLKDEDLWKKFGQYNRKMIEVSNNYDIEMGKVENLYLQLIARGT